MNFARIGPLGKEISVTVRDEKSHGLRGTTEDITADFLPGFDQASLETALSDGTLSPMEGEANARIGAPIARPSAIHCGGLSYPFLRDSDVVEIDVEGLGVQRQTLRALLEEPQ